MDDLMGAKRGLDVVLVRRPDVLAKVLKNRDAHRAKFEEAMEGYKKRSIELLEEHIDRIKSNAPERVTINLPFPTDHTAEYDRVIEQLEWSLDEHLELTQFEFNQFIRDEWGWKEAFAETHSMYTKS